MTTRALAAFALLLAAGCNSADVATDIGTCTTATGATTAAATAAGTASPTDIQAVVTAANAFYATLTTTQQSNVVVPITEGNLDNWSNLPVSTQNPRNGLQFGTLTSAQLTAALAVADAAFSDAGYATFQSIRAADEYIQTVGGRSGYGDELYYIAFLGTPSTTSEWFLQLGGHHYAVNFYYNGTSGTVSPTPNFLGSEPLSFSLNGTTYTPMEGRRAAATAMFDALSTTELAASRLTQTFGDILLGPGQDGNFPTTPVGLQVSTLTSAQQALVVDAMEAWVNDADPANAEALLAAYSTPEALAQTYIAYSTNPDLNAQRSYIRIDGPRVWIEIVAQNGVVFSGIHYHSIWRDSALDYGGRFFTASEEGPSC